RGDLRRSLARPERRRRPRRAHRSRRRRRCEFRRPRRRARPRGRGRCTCEGARTRGEHDVTRALVVAYYFPPIGGAGAQRPAKLVRYLPSQGIEPIVVTGPGRSEGRWTPADETLNVDVAPSTVVLRVPGPEPAGATGWRG